MNKKEEKPLESLLVPSAREGIRVIVTGGWVIVFVFSVLGQTSEPRWNISWIIGTIASGIGLLIARHGRESPGLLLAVAACCLVAVIAIATASSTSGLTIAIASCAVGLALGALAWGNWIPPADPLPLDGCNDPSEME